MSRLEARLLRKTALASRDFGLLEPNDRIMVGMSGGKDSYVMLHLLRILAARMPFKVELIPTHLDQGQPGFPTEILTNWMAQQGLEHHVIREHTYEIVKAKTPEGKAYCSMCSRMRRGILYTSAQRLKCTKIALGHHRDDAIETLMLNLLYAGQIKAMPPRLVSDDGRNIVIRPMINCAEADIAQLASEMDFPILPCTLCSSQPDLKRAKIKALITELHEDNPNVRGSMYAALSNVVPSHLMDEKIKGLMREADLRADDDSLTTLEEGPSAGSCSL